MHHFEQSPNSSESHINVKEFYSLLTGFYHRKKSQKNVTKKK